MKETPNTPTEDAERPRQSMTMMELAEKDQRVPLIDYINHTKERYKNEGVTVDNFRYFPATDTEPSKVEITFTPARDQEGHHGISHGGISTFMIDSSAGAFAMSVGKPNQVAITNEHLNIKFPGFVRTGVPVRVVSRKATDVELKEEEDKGLILDKRQTFVHTDVIQDGEVVTSGKTVCSSIPNRALK
ncbi:PaaI family thioesterase [Candidatus Kaiserbacteria bacterium]|nr:MAG: PaaI family thioesterase [Candidatus Kaiserbacteria bacterium]